MTFKKILKKTRGSSIKEMCEWYELDNLSNSFGTCTWSDVLAVSGRDPLFKHSIERGNYTFQLNVLRKSVQTNSIKQLLVGLPIG